MAHDRSPFGDDLFGAEHVRVYRETGGEQGYDWRGTTILLLTTTGRNSGQERTTPLIHRVADESWVVIARIRGRGRASGLEMDWHQGYIWTVRDGKAVRFRWFNHPADALAAAGLA